MDTTDISFGAMKKCEQSFHASSFNGPFYPGRSSSLSRGNMNEFSCPDAMDLISLESQGPSMYPESYDVVNIPVLSPKRQERLVVLEKRGSDQTQTSPKANENLTAEEIRRRQMGSACDYFRKLQEAHAKQAQNNESSETFEIVKEQPPVKTQCIGLIAPPPAYYTQNKPEISTQINGPTVDHRHSKPNIDLGALVESTIIDKPQVADEKSIIPPVVKTFSQHWIVIGQDLKVLLLDFDSSFTLLIPNVEKGNAFKNNSTSVEVQTKITQAGQKLTFMKFRFTNPQTELVAPVLVDKNSGYRLLKKRSACVFLGRTLDDISAAPPREAQQPSHFYRPQVPNKQPQTFVTTASGPSLRPPQPVVVPPSQVQIPKVSTPPKSSTETALVQIPEKNRVYSHELPCIYPALKDHELTKILECRYCKKRFHFLSEHLIHLKSHTKDVESVVQMSIQVWVSDRKLKCEKCKKKATYTLDYAKHKDSHDVAGLSCHFCQASISKPSDFGPHLEKHHQEAIFFNLHPNSSSSENIEPTVSPSGPLPLAVKSSPYNDSVVLATPVTSASSIVSPMTSSSDFAPQTTNLIRPSNPSYELPSMSPASFQSTPALPIGSQSFMSPSVAQQHNFELNSIQVPSNFMPHSVASSNFSTASPIVSSPTFTSSHVSSQFNSSVMTDPLFSDPSIPQPISASSFTHSSVSPSSTSLANKQCNSTTLTFSGSSESPTSFPCPQSIFSEPPSLHQSTFSELPMALQPPPPPFINPSISTPPFAGSSISQTPLTPTSMAASSVYPAPNPSPASFLESADSSLVYTSPSHFPPPPPSNTLEFSGGPLLNFNHSAMPTPPLSFEEPIQNSSPEDLWRCDENKIIDNFLDEADSGVLVKDMDKSGALSLNSVDSGVSDINSSPSALPGTVFDLPEKPKSNDFLIPSNTSVGLYNHVETELESRLDEFSSSSVMQLEELCNSNYISLEDKVHPPLKGIVKISNPPPVLSDESESEEPIHKCSGCGQAFVTFNSLNIHKMHSCPDQKKCPHCNDRFMSLNSLKMHSAMCKRKKLSDEYKSSYEDSKEPTSIFESIINEPIVFAETLVQPSSHAKSIENGNLASVKQNKKQQNNQMNKNNKKQKKKLSSDNKQLKVEKLDCDQNINTIIPGMKRAASVSIEEAGNLKLKLKISKPKEPNSDSFKSRKRLLCDNFNNSKKEVNHHSNPTKRAKTQGGHNDEKVSKKEKIGLIAEKKVCDPNNDKSTRKIKKLNIKPLVVKSKEKKHKLNNLSFKDKSKSRVKRKETLSNLKMEEKKVAPLRISFNKEKSPLKLSLKVPSKLPQEPIKLKINLKNVESQSQGLPFKSSSNSDKSGKSKGALKIKPVLKEPILNTESTVSKNKPVLDKPLLNNKSPAVKFKEPLLKIKTLSEKPLLKIRESSFMAKNESILEEPKLNNDSNVKNEVPLLKRKPIAEKLTLSKESSITRNKEPLLKIKPILKEPNLNNESSVTKTKEFSIKIKGLKDHPIIQSNLDEAEKKSVELPFKDKGYKKGSRTQNERLEVVNSQLEAEKSSPSNSKIGSLNVIEEDKTEEQQPPIKLKVLKKVSKLVIKKKIIQSSKPVKEKKRKRVLLISDKVTNKQSKEYESKSLLHRLKCLSECSVQLQKIKGVIINSEDKVGIQIRNEDLSLLPGITHKSQKIVPPLKLRINKVLNSEPQLAPISKVDLKKGKSLSLILQDICSKQVKVNQPLRFNSMSKKSYKSNLTHFKGLSTALIEISRKQCISKIDLKKNTTDITTKKFALETKSVNKIIKPKILPSYVKPSLVVPKPTPSVIIKNPPFFAKKSSGTRTPIPAEEPQIALYQSKSVLLSVEDEILRDYADSISNFEQPLHKVENVKDVFYDDEGLMVAKFILNIIFKALWTNVVQNATLIPISKETDKVIADMAPHRSSVQLANSKIEFHNPIELNAPIPASILKVQNSSSSEIIKPLLNDVLYSSISYFKTQDSKLIAKQILDDLILFICDRKSADSQKNIPRIPAVESLNKTNNNGVFDNNPAQFEEEINSKLLVHGILTDIICSACKSETSHYNIQKMNSTDPVNNISFATQESSQVTCFSSVNFNSSRGELFNVSTKNFESTDVIVTQILNDLITCICAKKWVPGSESQALFVSDLNSDAKVLKSPLETYSSEMDIKKDSFDFTFDASFELEMSSPSIESLESIKGLKLHYDSNQVVSEILNEVVTKNFLVSIEQKAKSESISANKVIQSILKTLLSRVIKQSIEKIPSIPINQPYRLVHRPTHEELELKIISPVLNRIISNVITTASIEPEIEITSNLDNLDIILSGLTERIVSPILSTVVSAALDTVLKTNKSDTPTAKLMENKSDAEMDRLNSNTESITSFVSSPFLYQNIDETSTQSSFSVVENLIDSLILKVVSRSRAKNIVSLILNGLVYKVIKLSEKK